MQLLNLLHKGELQPNEPTVFEEILGSQAEEVTPPITEEISDTVEEKEVEPAEEEFIPRRRRYEEEELEEVEEDEEEEGYDLPETKKKKRWLVPSIIVIVLLVTGYFSLQKYPGLLDWLPFGGGKKSEQLASETTTTGAQVTTSSETPTSTSTSNLPTITKPERIQQLQLGKAFLNQAKRIFTFLPATIYLENLLMNHNKLLLSFYSYGIQEYRFFQMDMRQNLGLEKPDRTSLEDNSSVPGTNFRSVFSYSLSLLPSPVSFNFLSYTPREIENQLLKFLHTSGIQATQETIQYLTGSASKTIELNFTAGYREFSNFLNQLYNSNLNISLKEISLESNLSLPFDSTQLKCKLTFLVI